MRTRIVVMLLMLSLIGASMAMAACQKNTTTSGAISSTTTSSTESDASSDEATSSEEASSEPELCVNSEGEVVDSSGNTVSGYEVSSKGEIVSSATGSVVVPAGSANATSSAAAPAAPTASKPTTTTSKAPAAHTHSYTATVVKPTCTAQGYTTHKCSCGNSYEDSTTAALGHSYGAWVVTKSATTTAEGTQTRTCSRCGVTESQSIPKLQAAAASAADAQKIADQVITYINQYRKAQGGTQIAKLPGMTQVAQMRSKQLVTNFEHSTEDQRKATMYYKYGEYINAAEWGMTGENYYELPAREAIGQSYTVGSVDEIAKNLADGVHNSSGHWSYVGSSSYSYIAVGVTYGRCSGSSTGYGWYCCIYVSNTNQYG